MSRDLSQFPTFCLGPASINSRDQMQCSTQPKIYVEYVFMYVCMYSNLFKIFLQIGYGYKKIGYVINVSLNTQADANAVPVVPRKLLQPLLNMP